ncbi:DUF1833 family protein [Pseudoxanthomonas winnipegensis]|uniref:DUF1833 domain-containing protein n=1 Tax=Pseudoxanthomonas winnipegensis TaxID=2480810 RepID=A0A4Q8LZT1_9GAMM|nr:DUF1833 family protein [Pseudoxanthomonas winnipegensis]RZZ90590.1 DUF1833 domain-containing protein [Pseudoxanthomonas winnipegensis]TAA37254.1 DUF1833 domain-containing protein [Pseudoxanthomonas winnipegensis]
MSTFIERRQRRTDTESILLFAEISATSFADTLRIVNDTRNWVSNGVEYIGFPFGFKLPDDVSGQTPRAQLVIDNVGRGMTDDLERLQPNELVMAKILISDRADPDTIFRTLYLPMTQVSVNASTATAQCGVDYLMRQRAVRLVCNPYTLPGAF